MRLARAADESRCVGFEMFLLLCRRRTDLRRPGMAARWKSEKIERECARKNKNRFRIDEEIDNKPIVMQP